MERLPWLTLQSSSLFGCGIFRISQCGWLSREFCLFLWFPGLEPGASTSAIRVNPGFTAATQERTQESFFNAF